MKQVVFIEIPAKNKLQFFRRLCGFVGGQVEGGRFVALLAGNRDQARYLDDLLWTHDESRFVPHSVLSEETSPLEPIVIVVPGIDCPAADLIINFSEEAVATSRVSSVAEIPGLYEIVPAPGSPGRDASRAKWNRYREEGLAVSHQPDL